MSFGTINSRNPDTETVGTKNKIKNVVNVDIIVAQLQFLPHSFYIFKPFQFASIRTSFNPLLKIHLFLLYRLTIDLIFSLYHNHSTVRSTIKQVLLYHLSTCWIKFEVWAVGRKVIKCCRKQPEVNHRNFQGTEKIRDPRS